MDVRLLGTGGPAGWPEPGCRCASCRARGGRRRRRPGGVLVDGRLRIDPGQPPRGGRGRLRRRAGARRLGHHRARRRPAARRRGTGPGTRARQPERCPSASLLLDLLAEPAQLGALRARGLARAGHRRGASGAPITGSRPSAELARRAGLWRVAVPGDGDTLRAAAAGPGPGRRAGSGRRLPHRTLVLGGARSGKSREAELRLAAEPQVTYLAAGPWPDGAARGRRPAPTRVGAPGGRAPGRPAGAVAHRGERRRGRRPAAAWTARCWSTGSGPG